MYMLVSSLAVKNVQGSENRGAGAFLAPNGKMVEIRDVWRHNLDQEMANVRKVSYSSLVYSINQ